MQTAEAYIHEVNGLPCRMHTIRCMYTQCMRESAIHVCACFDTIQHVGSCICMFDYDR